jgi:hypothetical protein
METNIDKDLLWDLTISLPTHKEFYELTRSLRLCLAKKMAKGIYNKDLAVKPYIAAIKTYSKTKEFQRIWPNLRITKDELNIIAVNLVESYEETIIDLSKDLIKEK